MTSKAQRCDNVGTTLSDVATKIQPKPNVVTTSCASCDVYVGKSAKELSINTDGFIVL